MAALSAGVAREFVASEYLAMKFPVSASTTIYEGGACVVGLEAGSDDGNVIPMPADPSNTAFTGFARETVDNSAGADGDKEVLIQLQGVVKLSVTGVVAGDEAEAVYASSDNDFTLTAGSDLPIGRVVKVVSAGVAFVHFKARALRDDINLVDAVT